MNDSCERIEDHTPDAFIIDEDMNVLLKCTKCDWELIQIVDQYQTQQIDFNKE
jgi:hypothetical protein